MCPQFPSSSPRSKQRYLHRNLEQEQIMSEIPATLPPRVSAATLLGPDLFSNTAAIRYPFLLYATPSVKLIYHSNEKVRKLWQLQKLLIFTWQFSLLRILQTKLYHNVS